MVNVGWWNRRGRLAPSIFCVKGDLETWLNALFMALFPRPLWGRLLFLRLWWYSLSQEKVSLGKVLDLRLCCARHNSFFNSSISRCMSLSFLSWETWLFLQDWLLLVCVVCTLLSWSPLCWRFTKELLCWEPPDSAWCKLASSWFGPIVGWCRPKSSIFNAIPESPSEQI